MVSLQSPQYPDKLSTAEWWPTAGLVSEQGTFFFPERANTIMYLTLIRTP